MEVSAIPGWSDFFVAAAGVAGALAGLLFVAVSLNLARIIEGAGLTGRAGETLLVLAGALVGSLVALVPHVSPERLGVVLLAVTLPTWVIPMLIQWRAGRTHVYDHRRGLQLFRLLTNQIATLPGVLGGLSLLGWVPGGIGWFAAGVIASMLVAMLNAWVLLVEILR